MGALFPRMSNPIFHESLCLHPIPLQGYVPRPFISISLSLGGIRSRSSQQSVFGSVNANDWATDEGRISPEYIHGSWSWSTMTSAFPGSGSARNSSSGGTIVAPTAPFPVRRANDTVLGSWCTWTGPDAVHYLILGWQHLQDARRPWFPSPGFTRFPVQGWVTKRRRSFGTRTSGQLESTASAGPPPTLTVRQPVRARGYCENKTMNTNLLKKVQRLEFMGASHSLCSTMLAALEVILPIKLHKSALAEAARFRTRPLCGTGRTGWGTKRWKSTEGRSMISLFNTVCCSFQLTWAVEWTIGRRMSAPSIPGCKFTYMPRTFL